MGLFNGSNKPKRNVGYFVNWAIYGRKYLPQQLPSQHLTHVLYAFANVRDTGEVFLTDAWADAEIHWDGDSWNDQGTNLYGCFKQLYLLKKKNPHLKVLLSIGGWTFSSNFAAPASRPEGRAEFARSAAKIVEDFGIDGLDIDWEYPANEDQAQHYVLLLAECRRALDELARSKGENNSYELTIAAPCGTEHYQKLKIKEMDQYLDFWNLMAYDYSGSWDSVAGHQANLFPNKGLSTATAVSHYRKSVPSHKLVVGIPLYGRSFTNTDGPGSAYQGVGQGSWDQGVYDYKALPLPDSTVQEDKKLGASWSYNSTTRELVSYDTVPIAELKAKWIHDEKLGGAMYWETSADHPPDHPQSIIRAVASVFAKDGLDEKPNHLSFPNSKYDNLRNGMN